MIVLLHHENWHLDNEMELGSHMTTGPLTCVTFADLSHARRNVFLNNKGIFRLILLSEG